MANIIFNVAAKVFIQFTPTNINLTREVQNDITATISYTQGLGQTLTAGQVLYTVGTVGTSGYLQITAAGNTTISGSGSFTVNISSIPTSTVADGSVTFQIDGSNVVININYQSRPETEDIYKSIDNRSTYQFTTSDFTTAFSDFDSDTLIEVMADNNVVNYEYQGNPYVAGTWIPLANIGQLEYTGADQNNAYVQTTPWYGKDSTGMVSL